MRLLAHRVSGLLRGRPALILALAIALSAVTAASASAETYQFKAAEYPAAVRGHNTNIHAFDIAGVPIKCHSATFNSNEGGANGLTGPSTFLTLHPIYTECETSLAGLGNSEVTVRTTGSNYTFNALEPGLKTGAVALGGP